MQLQTLEKLVKRIIRKSLKNNTLDYTVQISISSPDPGDVKYSAMISSPASGVQPILLSYDSYDLLLAALKEAEKEYNPRSIEIAYHDNRINTFEHKAAQHKARKEKLEDPEYDEDAESIELEEVLSGKAN